VQESDIWRFARGGHYATPDNAISHIPGDIVELSMEFAGRINLRGNPLSQDSVQ
jgi:hypothetical protein